LNTVPRKKKSGLSNGRPLFSSSIEGEFEMNRLFWKSKKRKPGTKPTVDQEFKKMDLKLRRIAQKEFISLAIENPEVRLQLIEREFGIKIPERDPLKEVKEKIHKVITDRAADRIENNPKLVENLSQGLIKKYAADLGIQTNDAPGTPFERDLLLIEQYHKIKEGLGFKDSNSIWGTIKNPQVVIGFLGLIGQLASMMRSDPKPSERIYVVNVDGKDIEMNEEEHTAYKQTGALAKKTSSKTPHTDGALSEAAPKEIHSYNDQPGDGIQVIVCHNPQKESCYDVNKTG